MRILIGIFMAWAVAWAVVVTLAPSLWIVAALGFAQNLAFTFVSRGRNSGSLVYHMVASIFSNGIWLGMFVIGVKIAAEAPTFPMEFAAVYILSTMAGSVFAHWLARKVERGKARNVQEDRVGELEERLKYLENQIRFMPDDAVFGRIGKLEIAAKAAATSREELDGRIDGLLNGVDAHEQGIEQLKESLRVHILHGPGTVDDMARQELADFKTAYGLDDIAHRKELAALRNDLRGDHLVDIKKRLAAVEAAAGKPSSTIKGLRTEINDLAEAVSNNVRQEAMADRRLTARLERLEIASGVVYDPEEGTYDYAEVRLTSDEQRAIDLVRIAFPAIDECKERLSKFEADAKRRAGYFGRQIEDIREKVELYPDVHPGRPLTEEQAERLNRDRPADDFAFLEGDVIEIPKVKDLEDRVEDIEDQLQDLEKRMPAPCGAVPAYKLQGPSADLTPSGELRLRVEALESKTDILRIRLESMYTRHEESLVDAHGALLAHTRRLEALEAEPEWAAEIEEKVAASEKWEEPVAGVLLELAELREAAEKAKSSRLGLDGRLEALSEIVTHNARAVTKVHNTCMDRLEDLETRVVGLSEEVGKIAAKVVGIPMARLGKVEEDIRLIRENVQGGLPGAIEELTERVDSYVAELVELRSSLDLHGKWHAESRHLKMGVDAELLEERVGKLETANCKNEQGWMAHASVHETIRIKGEALEREVAAIGRVIRALREFGS